MKKTLSLIAMGAILCGGVSYGLTSTTAATTTQEVTIDTSSTYYAGGTVSYADGVLTGANLSGITFEYDYSEVDTAKAIIYTGVNSGADVAYGLFTTADGGITGAWKSSTDAALAAWTGGGTVANTVFSGKDTEETGSIKLTVALDNGKGVAFAAGDSVTLANNANENINGDNSTAETEGDLYRAFGLKSSSANTSTVTLDAGYISKIYITDTLGGETTYTSNGVSVVKAVGTHVNATNGRVQLNGGNNGSAASTSATGNPIYVGGKGQLFLQTWDTGAITLNNDIYLGSSTHGDVPKYGVIRFGNDGGHATTLNGEIVVLENTSMKSGGNNAISITGNVTDKKNIDGSVSEGGKTLTIGGKGYTFSGNVNVSNLDFAAGTAATFTNGFTTDSLTLGNNVALASSTTLTLADLTVGTGVTLDAALNLSEGATVTMAGALALGENALSMGSLTLSGALMEALGALTEGTTVNLFTGVSSLTLAGTGFNALTSADGMDLSQYLTGVDADKYYLGYENNTVYAGLVTPDAPVIDPTVPEPATATLSLLALAALAARRRRR